MPVVPTPGAVTPEEPDAKVAEEPDAEVAEEPAGAASGAATPEAADGIAGAGAAAMLTGDTSGPATPSEMPYARAPTASAVEVSAEVSLHGRRADEGARRSRRVARS